MATITTGSQATYDLIATLSGTNGPLSFTSIPQTYHSLIIHGFPLASGAPNSLGAITFNSDTTFNYRRSNLSAVNYMSVSATYDFGSSTVTAFNSGFMNTSGNGGIWHIPDYTNTTRVKTIYCNAGSTNGLGRGGGVWLNTAAITTITFTASNHTAGTVFHLYGLKKV